MPIVDLLLETQSDEITAEDDDGCTILCIAFAREKTVWEPVLKRHPIKYFYQFLLCAHFHSKMSNEVLNYFVSEYEGIDFLDDRV